LKVGQLGFQGGQVAPRDRAFLLQDGEVVGSLEGHQGVLFFFELLLLPLHLRRDRGKGASGDHAADVSLVLEVHIHESVQIILGVSGLGTGGLDQEDGALRGARDANEHGQRLTVCSHGDNDIGAGGSQARQGKFPESIALEQLGLGAQKILNVLGEQAAFRQAQFDGLPHASLGDKGRRLPKNQGSPGAEAKGQRQSRDPPIFQQETQEPLNPKGRGRRGGVVHGPVHGEVTVRLDWCREAVHGEKAESRKQKAEILKAET